MEVNLRLGDPEDEINSAVEDMLALYEENTEEFFEFLMDYLKEYVQEYGHLLLLIIRKMKKEGML